MWVVHSKNIFDNSELVPGLTLQFVLATVN